MLKTPTLNLKNPWSWRSRWSNSRSPAWDPDSRRWPTTTIRQAFKP